MKQGKVYLVGAGPSDEGLFTIKGNALLKKADAVVYDALVGSSIVAMIPENAEKIYVGKHSGHHTIKQEEISRLLVRLAKQGKEVVRLKGGDPFLFGRGGEELEELIKEGITFEVVPGVTSALSVPAYAGIPVTHREFSSSLHIITGHKKQGETLQIDFDALVKAGGTYVFLMGVTAMEDICNGFLKAGMEPEMPAAMISQGTTSRQRRVVATLCTLVEKVKKEKLETPAILMIGQVCRRAEAFTWYEKLPLFGKKIVVTRPADRSKGLAMELRSRGAEVLEIPTIVTKPAEDRKELISAIHHMMERTGYDAVTRRDRVAVHGAKAEYERAVEHDTIEKNDKNAGANWLVFTSPAGVDYFFNVLFQEKLDIRCLSGVKIAVIGSGTKAQLEEKGIFADLMPEEYHGEALGKKLAEVLSPGDHVMIPRARMGNQELIQEIRRVPDVVIEDIALYDTTYAAQSAIDLKELFEKEPDTLVVFTSSSTVKGFVSMTEGLDYRGVKAICIGKQTARTAAEYGMQCEISKEATMNGLVEVISNL